jgi:hypothetical protein
MKSREIMAFVVVLFFAGIITAGAVENFDVMVYEGATYDDSTSKYVSKSMHFTAVCYRTNDSVVKVVAFFMKQHGLKLVAGRAEGAMFQKGNVDITIQSPWMEMKSGKMMKDTLISIVKR